MHVLVATDGSMDVDKAARFAVSMAGDGKTTVGTVIRVPRQMLQELRSKYGENPPVTADIDAEYVGAPNVETAMEKGFPGDDSLVARYLIDKREEICSPIADAITGLGGTAEKHVVEGDDIDEDILDMAKSLGADVLVVGSHGRHAFQGLLGSTGAKVVRRSPIPVLVIR
ncbi:MAG: universal stress protein [Acidimicrobiia bacterium]|nr:universal stress protein [Acidimicrobiia bacterium]